MGFLARLVLVIGLVLTVVASPASAKVRVFRDAHDDVGHFDAETQRSWTGRGDIDIYRVRVAYRAHKLVVRTVFRNLTRKNTTNEGKENGNHSYYFDTNRDHKGYEYELTYVEGGGAVLIARGRRGAHTVCGNEPHWKVDLDKDVSRLVLPRHCFRKKQRRYVRVRVEVSVDGPDTAPAPSGGWYLDHRNDEKLTGYTRYSRS